MGSTLKRSSSLRGGHAQACRSRRSCGASATARRQRAVNKATVTSAFLQSTVLPARHAEMLGHEVKGVAIELGEQDEGCLQCVEGRVGERRQAGVPRLQREPLEVEGQVLPYEYRVAGEGAQLPVGIGEARCAGKRLIGDAGQPLHVQRDRQAGIDELREAPSDGKASVRANSAQLDDAVVDRVETGGLGVDEDKLGRACGHGRQDTRRP